MREVQRLSERRLRGLQAAPLTYDEVGASAAAYPSGLPAGYRLIRHRAVVGSGGAHFRTARDRLLTWQMHLRAGLRVAASSPTVEVGGVVLQRLGLGPLALRIPCRVVYLVEEPDAAGFAYGTLPGHPESGEESFLVRHDGSGGVTFTVTAFSRPGTLLAQLGGPVTWRAQEAMLRRYAAALT